MLKPSVRSARRVREASKYLRQAGIAAELSVWEGLWPVFEYYYADIPEARVSLVEVAAYIDRHLAR